MARNREGKSAGFGASLIWFLPLPVGPGATSQPLRVSVFIICNRGTKTPMGKMRNAHGDARGALEIPRKYGFRYYVIINTEGTRGEHESRPRIQGSGIPVVSEGGRRGAVETFISGVSALHTWVPCGQHRCAVYSHSGGWAVSTS